MESYELCCGCRWFRKEGDVICCVCPHRCASRPPGYVTPEDGIRYERRRRQDRDAGRDVRGES
jgi:hypothetical protein